MKRYSSVIWKGSGKEGSGSISSQSNALNNAQYAWNTRFENEKGTNPEELIAAAHASCFTMKLSFLLSDAGFIPEQIKTTSTVAMSNGAITDSHLSVKAIIPRISREKFESFAEDAKMNCPVSKVLNLNITMEALLEEVPAVRQV